MLGLEVSQFPTRAIVVFARAEHTAALAAVGNLNDTDTEKAVQVERDFLSTLMGGCSTPISAHCRIRDGKILLDGSILSLDGREKFACNLSENPDNYKTMGARAANQLLLQGADKIVQQIRQQMPDNPAAPSHSTQP